MTVEELRAHLMSDLHHHHDWGPTAWSGYIDDPEVALAVVHFTHHGNPIPPAQAHHHHEPAWAYGVDW